MGHVLDSTRQQQLGIAVGNGRSGKIKGLQAGGAKTVNGGSRNAVGQPGKQRRKPGDIFPLLQMLSNTTDVDIVDGGEKRCARRQTTQQPTHHFRQQGIGTYPAKLPLVGVGPTNGRAFGFNHINVHFHPLQRQQAAAFAAIDVQHLAGDKFGVV